MKIKNLFVALTFALFLFSCSEEEELQPANSPDPVQSKAQSDGSHQEHMAGVLGEIRINENGQAECIMSTDPMQVSPSEFEVSGQAGKSNAVSVSKKMGNGTAKITVIYLGFTPEAQAAFQAAVDVWSSLLDSDVEIFVLAQFAPLGPGILGSAGSTFIIRDFPGARRDTWYGNALGDKLAGVDLVPGFFDLSASFSSVFPNWYFGTDGNTPPGDFDFFTVVLHELCHGLNFFGGMTVNSGIGSYGFGLTPALPTIYDQFTITRPGRQLVKENKFPNPSIALGNALTGEQILFSASNTISTTQGDRATLFTPMNWRPGSSYSHLEESIYPTGTTNALMTPFLARGEHIGHPGPIVLSMFDDMGWSGKIKKPVN